MSPEVYYPQIPPSGFEHETAGLGMQRLNHLVMSLILKKNVVANLGVHL